MFPITIDQLGIVAAGFLLVIVIALSWSLSKRTAFEHGYYEGKHDREHWENEEVVKGKLRRK